MDRFHRAIVAIALSATSSSAAAAGCHTVFADGFEVRGPFRVVEAVATSAFSYEVCFNHTISAASLDMTAQQFAVPGVTGNSASWQGTSVVVATATNLDPASFYTLTVTASLLDLDGNPLAAGANVAAFPGFSP